MKKIKIGTKISWNNNFGFIIGEQSSTSINVKFWNGYNKIVPISEIKIINEVGGDSSEITPPTASGGSLNQSTGQWQDDYSNYNSSLNAAEPTNSADMDTQHSYQDQTENGPPISTVQPVTPEISPSASGSTPTTMTNSNNLPSVTPTNDIASEAFIVKTIRRIVKEELRKLRK